MASRNRRKRRTARRSVRHRLAFAAGFVALGVIAAGSVAAGWAIHVYDSAPPLASLKPVSKGRSSAIYAADGSLIGFIRSANVRQPISTRAMPQTLRDATIAIEDKNFYHHGGIDPAGIARAAWKDILAGGKPVQGASTITQQLVRNLYIQNPQETIRRKLIEAHLAEEMEEAHSKEWILTSYLNTAPYGTVEGETAVGVQAAAETYYGKPAKRLTLPEAAMIAGLPQAPSEYNPFLDPKAAKVRRNEVLTVMEEQGYIDGSEYRAALHDGLGLHPGHKYRVIRDPLLFDLVQQQLIDRYGVNTVRNGGLKAYTTIDPRLQQDAEEAVASCGNCYTGGGPAAALASVDPQTGEIVALASSEEEGNQFNYAWQAHRQPGSSFKTYVLTTAIKQGIDPYSTYYDGTSPKTLVIPGGSTWTVNNAEQGGGTMSLAEATWNSVNVVYAQLDLDVGPEEVTKTAHEMGITAPLESVPAEAIGGLAVGVTPLEMADGYATLASGGIHHDATAVARVEFPDGKVDELDSKSGNRVLTPGQAWDVTKLLEGVITHGTGTGFTYMGCTSEAGKTGTSEGLSDAWFVGYTPKYSTAVWVGHPESREETGFGGPTAGPIWRAFMERAQGSECPDFEEPTDLPELKPYNGGHTTGSSSYSSPSNEEEEFSEPYEEEFSEPQEEEGEEGGGGESGSPHPAPAPAPPSGGAVGIEGGGVAAH